MVRRDYLAVLPVISLKQNRMMRQILLTRYSIIFLFLTLSLAVSAQKQKTVFQDLSWEQAAELAQKEGKIVLVDAMMKPRTPQDREKMEQAARALFTQPEVADFCKKNVIAIQIDMASEAGHAFAPKMVMYMYPAYAFFMPNGDILGVASPFLAMKDPAVLLKAGEKAWESAKIKRQNSRFIVFEELTLEEAFAKAKKENKLVFADTYTTWCQPCVLMTKNIFTLDRVADFYNRHFINLKLDFTKEKELTEKYGIDGFPTYLFFNGDGKVVYKAGGYTEEEPFIGYGETALKKAEGIEFTQVGWQEVLDQAKKANKLIFMDCYTSWCGPCKMLAKTVFTDPDVAALFNEKFVNVKMDMEKGKGVQLKDKYGIKAYPTLLFIDGNGEVVHRVVGGVDLKTLMNQANLALAGKGLAHMTAVYRQGERTPEFIQEYLEILDVANLKDEAEKVCLDYFANLDKNKLKEKECWNLFVRFVNDVNAEVFTYVYDHRVEFYPVFGEREVKRKISRVWAIGANQFVTGQGDEATLDAKGFKRYIKRLSKADVDGKYEIIATAQMTNAEKTGDWKTYLALGNERLKSGKVSDLMLYNWGLRVNRLCKDPALRLKAARWFDEAAAESEKDEANKNGMMSYRTYFEKIAADLKQPAQ